MKKHHTHTKNKLILGAAVLLLVVLWMIIGSKKSGEVDTTNMKVAPLETSGPSSAPSVTGPTEAPPATSSVAKPRAVRSYTVLGSNFSFTPKRLLAKKGDTVTITFQNQSGFHDFKIDAFNVATKQINGGKSETVTFVATKSGTFEYYCSVGNHRAMGMVGALTVTE
ncbi:hypothetical protein BH11PAT3_BH11PAT3_2390 [soil metagenome]